MGKADFPGGWRTMWLFAMFDLPTKTDRQRKAYVRFRKRLLNDGFTMMQYSVYHRFCHSLENAEAHIRRMTADLPDEGEVRFMLITDKQFGKIQTYWGKGRQPEEKSPPQLQFF